MATERQDDTLVLKDGRKNTLKDAEAPLRDQIPKKLFKKLVENKAGIKISNMWHAAITERSNWMERQRAFLADWDEFLTNDSTGPFAGSSQLHLPTGFTAAKTYHARFMEALFGMDPPFSLKPGPFAAKEEANAVSDLMRYTLKDWANYKKGIESTVDRWVWDWIVTGTGVMKRRWDCKYVSYMDVETTIEQTAPKFIIDPNTGQEVLVPQYKSVEKEVLRTDKVFDGPVFENLLIEDYVAIGQPDNLSAEIQRQMLTASELWTLVDRKVFDEEAVRKIIAAGPDKKGIAMIASDRDLHSGISQEYNSTDLDKYEILEAYVQLDVDGSGINSEVVVWVHTTTYEIVRATYLHRINKAGKRPFSVIHFHRRQNSLYGMGLIEVLYPLIRELDAMRNMRVDYGLFAAAPFFFYRAASSLNPETLQVSPGTGIPVDNPQTDVYFPNLGARSAFGAQEEAAIHTAIEKMTGLSSLSYGSMDGQGATRTATGTRSLVAEANSNLNIHLRRLNVGWKDAMIGLFHDLQQRVEPGFVYKTTGNDGAQYWERINLETLMKDYDFEIDANSAVSNPMIKVDNAQQILQLTANPIDIQLGIITPSTRYEAVKNYLQALGIRDVSHYVSKPQQYSLRLSPQEEIQRLFTGYAVPVQLTDDHEGFIEYANQLLQKEDMVSQLTEMQVVAVKRQMQMHIQALEALQQQQAQQANAQQQQINSAQAGKPQ